MKLFDVTNRAGKNIKEDIYEKVTQSDGTVTVISSHKVDGKNQVSMNHPSDLSKHMNIGAITISPPKGITTEQFDKSVLDQGQSMIDSESLDYSAFPGADSPGEGNCNTTTRNLINGAGGKIPQGFDPKGMNPDLHGNRKTDGYK